MNVNYKSLRLVQLTATPPPSFPAISLTDTITQKLLNEFKFVQGHAKVMLKMVIKNPI